MGAGETPLKRAIAWARPDQVGLVRQVCARAKVDLVGAGSPTKGQTGAVAADLACAATSDVRVALTEGDADAILIFDPGEFGHDSESNDASAIASANARGVLVASLEAIPESVQAIASGMWAPREVTPAAWSHIRVLGLPRHAASMRDAMERIGDLGVIRSATMACWSSPAEGSLGARLIGALDTLIHLLGEPEFVDASYVSTVSARGLHALPPETLQGVNGDMTANLRFANGRSASIAASNHAGRFAFALDLLAEKGRLHVSEQGLVWFGPGGDIVDESRPKRASRVRRSADGKSGAARAKPKSASGRKPASRDGAPSKASGEPQDATPPPSPGAVAMGDDLARLLDAHIPDVGPLDLPSRMSVAQAAMLSARTGQPESPETLRRLLENRP